jgi:hypothetical protein
MTDVPHDQTANTAPNAGPADVVIERLTLDVPGLDPADARALAAAVGERLARSGLSGDHARIGVTLGPVGGGQAELAQRIAAALMERLT